MKAAFYSGATGLMANQHALDSIGNNIANVNTNGYLPSNMSFQTLLNTEMYANTDDEPITEYGTKVVDLGLTIGSGSFLLTANELDFAVIGDGFFSVEVDNEIQYTKDGAFTLMLEDSTAFLGTVDGGYVLDENQNRIELELEEDSTVSYNLDGLKDRLGVYEFAYPNALDRASANRYTSNAQSGAGVSLQLEDRNIRQNTLQNSGTSLTDEMAEMITIQRAYQVSARVLQVADENEQTINSLRR